VTAAFIAYGISAGFWAGSIPAVMRHAGIDNLALGFGITAYGIAYVTTMSWGAKLARFATNRAIILASLPLIAISETLLLLSHTPSWFLASLAVFGALQGVLDLFMNAEASYVESELKRAVFTRFHAAASAAMAVFAVIGSLITANASPLWAVAILCLGLCAAVAFIARRLPARFSAMARVAAGAPPPRHASLILLGLAAGLVIAGETAAIMWSARLLDEQAPALAEIAGLGAAFYGLCNSAVRFAGDGIRSRFGDLPLIHASLLLAIAGFTLIGFSDGFLLSSVAFALTGFGTACIIPTLFAITARHMTENRARALAVVSLVAGVPRVMAPWVFGVVATAHSTSFAFGLCAAAMAVAAGFILAFQMLHKRVARPAASTAA
jgi:MFS family permease